MLLVSQFNQICLDIMSSVSSEIKEHILCATDDQAVNKLKDKYGPVLVAVYPSLDVSGRPGMSADDESTIFFIVEKFDTSQSEEKEQLAFERTQKIILAIKDYIIDQQASGCNTFFRLKPESMAIVPEYNVFGGFIGWSLTFSF